MFELWLPVCGHGTIFGAKVPVYPDSEKIGTTADAAFYMEENAKLLLDSYTMGTPIPMAEEEIKRAAENTFQPFSTKKTWEYYIDKGHKTGIFWDRQGPR